MYSTVPAADMDIGDVHYPVLKNFEDYHVDSKEYVERRQQKLNGRWQTVANRQQTADSRQEITDSRQQTANSRQ